MDTIRLVSKLYEDETTVIKPSSILSKEEIDKDNYLLSSFYFGIDRIRLVTPQFLIGSTKSIGPITSNDVSEYVIGLIQEQGRALVMFDSFHNIIVKPLFEKRFLSSGELRSIPFGLYNFIKPRPNDLNIQEPYRPNLPILIVEGLRDCLLLQQIYPYTLAMQTAGIPSQIKMVLSTLTNNLILGFDEDEAGMKAYNSVKYKTSFNISKLSYHPYKDGGTLSELYLKDSFKYQLFRSSLLTQLTILSKNIKY